MSQSLFEKSNTHNAYQSSSETELSAWEERPWKFISANWRRPLLLRSRIIYSLGTPAAKSSFASFATVSSFQKLLNLTHSIDRKSRSVFLRCDYLCKIKFRCAFVCSSMLFVPVRTPQNFRRQRPEARKTFHWWFYALKSGPTCDERFSAAAHTEVLWYSHTSYAVVRAMLPDTLGAT